MADTTILLKQQFATLCAQRDAALAVSTPLRTQRDSIQQQALDAVQPQIDAINVQIAAAETGLADIHNQIGMISVVLNGNTAQ